METDMKTNFLALKSFRDAREAAGLPVATAEQLKRTKRLIEGNPLLRGHRTPLGMELLAMRLPLDKNERRLKALEGVKYEPVDVRSDEALKQLAETPAVAQQFFESVNPRDEAEWMEAVCGAKGIDHATLVRQGKRIARFFAGPTRRVPSHIREKMTTMAVAAYGINRLKDEAAKDAAAAGAA
jgi:hypothetical protein